MAVARTVRVAAAQLGPAARRDSRAEVVARLRHLLHDAAASGVQLVVFPELALTTFFPRWALTPDELERYFESAMPGPDTQPLFDTARDLGIAFSLGFAEKAMQDGRARHFNSSLLVGPDGALVGLYRKVHLPGDSAPVPGLPFQHLEKAYFENGNLGFPAWRTLGGVLGMAICNDRRWPETYRVLGLQGAEMVLIGYNTPLHNPEAPQHDRWVPFHHRLVMQSGAYQNGMWVVAAAKAGCEEGVDHLGDSMIIAPSGEVVAQSATLGDELVIADCDLDLTRSYKDTIFNFAAHRRPEAYRLIVERTGAVPPEP